MSREANIPLFLWIATAALAHITWGGGAEQAAQVIDERLDVGRFAAGVRSHVRTATSPTLEISIEDDSAPDEVEPEEPAKEPPDDESQDEDEDEDDKTPPEVPKPKKPEPKKRVEPQPVVPEPEPETKKPDSPTPLAEAKPEAKPIEEKVVPLALRKAVAVRQHVDDEQPDNPDAAHISDKANKVEEETQARITSADQNDRKPTPGSAPSGPPETPGNAEETRVMQDTDQAGLRDVAPGGAESKRAERTAADLPGEKRGASSGAAPGPAGAQVEKPAVKAAPTSAEKNQTARAATPERLGAPEVVASDSGSFSMKRAENATPEQRARKAKKRLPPRRPRSLMESLGLGAAGITPGGVALNLTPSMATEAIGSDELSRLKRADGERRRSQHRGSWKVAGIERFRSAIENYVPSVKPGNQTALNTARVPFANYLNQIHNRLHPIFADSFLGSLDSLPSSHPMNDPTLVTSLEIVVEREEGRLVRRGVTRTSGVTAFDISAIESVDRAGPFGVPPAEIVSPDGNVYLHWEFHRDQMACSTYNAHPYILRLQPKPAPLPDGAPLPPFRDPKEPTPPTNGRHGLVTPKATPATPKDG